MIHVSVQTEIRRVKLGIRIFYARYPHAPDLKLVLGRNAHGVPLVIVHNSRRVVHLNYGAVRRRVDVRELGGAGDLGGYKDGVSVREIVD